VFHENADGKGGENDQDAEHAAEMHKRTPPSRPDLSGCGKQSLSGRIGQIMGLIFLFPSLFLVGFFPAKRKKERP
jgi:hypothetical protein